MTSPSSGHSPVPPGFRFHPTDEELVNYYLKKKVAMEKFELDVIRDVDLNKLEPWDLHERCRIDSTPQTEWYFFSHKDKKYPTGTRTNRATAAGFWKATGRDKAVHSHFKRIGMRKTLVFYRGRAPHGQKSDWIMHEYRLEETESAARTNEDGWVVCRVFKKRSHHQKGHEQRLAGSEETRHVDVLQKIESCSNLYDGKATPIRSIICKQESAYEDYGLHLQDPFLQLPSLESPKINSSTPTTNPFDLKRVVADNTMKRSELPSFYSLDVQNLESTKPFFMSEECLSTEYDDTTNLTEWGMLESISKDLRFNPDLSNFSNEVQYAPQINQPSLEYTNNCHMDLWNFPR